MQYAEPLQDLSREHDQSLAFAQKIADVATHGDEAALIDAIQTVKDYYDSELEVHFQHEERTVFAPIYKEYRNLIPLATALLKDHGALRKLIPNLGAENARDGLAEFARTLKTHTHVEEYELFPAVKALFTEEQLDDVLNFVPLD